MVRSWNFPGDLIIIHEMMANALFHGDVSILRKRASWRDDGGLRHDRFYARESIVSRDLQLVLHTKMDVSAKCLDNFRRSVVAIEFLKSISLEIALTMHPQVGSMRRMSKHRFMVAAKVAFSRSL